MPTAIERTVTTFIRAWSERDPAIRAKMIEACFAENGRMVTRSGEIRGRVALADEMTRVTSDPRLVRIRLTSVIDAKGTTFRYRGFADYSDGRSLENLDVGELDADGRIALVMAFGGPLGEPAADSRGGG
jgi:hypothetical protein